MLRGWDIVVLSSLDYMAHWTSKQQIMHRLAPTNRVLYVEEPVTMLAPFKVPERWRRWSAVPPRVSRAELDLWTLTPPPLLPFGNVCRQINRVNQGVIAAYVRWAVRRLGLRNYLLWSYLPTAVDIVELLDPAAVVYHCVDEHSAFPGFVKPEVVWSYDEQLCRRADLVICTADNLRAARAGFNPHVYHVPNAGDIDHFKQALDPAVKLPTDAAAHARPRIGVIGIHDERLDVQAIKAIAEADPSWNVLLIGPVRPGDVDEATLAALPNVHLLGRKQVPELPAYVKSLDIALIPYKTMELTRNIFPLKLFEYLAGGVPVIVSGLPELERYRGSIMLADGPQDFPRLIRQALAEDGPELRAERVRLAEQNSWDHRVEAISLLVEEMLYRKGLTTEAATGGGRVTTEGAL
ncbi:MAG: glycosyltransferase family 1 protein [Actinobacteria bacterium]|nr:glycosyltransferase family 1 protein [Actinomycetota bacterium]